MDRILLRPQRIAIHHKDTILVTDRQGWVGERRTGLFFGDTRYLSQYSLSLSGFEPRLLGISQPHYFAATFYYTNPRIGTEPRLVPESSLLLTVSRYLRDGLHEDVDLTNYTGKPLRVTLTFSFDADFADIFEVRDLERIVPRMAVASWDQKRRALRMSYRNGEFRRELVYAFGMCTSPPLHTLRTIVFDLRLGVGESWHACGEVHFEDRPAPEHHAGHSFPEVVRELDEWRAQVAEVSANDRIEPAYRQAVADLASLRLEEFGDRWFPAAGLPWFMATFGRDSLIVALQTLTAYCPFGLGVIERLTQLQGKRVNHWTEEEPGKLPHELRRGELASLGKIPHTPYYGSVDAPLLYVILLDELYRFTGDLRLLERYYLAARACLEWAARYGDIDGDGLIEYRPLSPKGYRNQGWKDAFDAVVYPDGSQVDPPIAIVEVQGYHYEALRRAAAIAELLGRADEAAEYRRRSREVYERLSEALWIEEAGTYAFGLDGRKEPIRTIASNPGHLLWSRAVPADRAGRLSRRLLATDMFSGWGVRTLSAANPAYDPISYQRGSVWPHDNALIALGLKRYGLWREANVIAEAIFAAARHYEHSSLPEVFAGIDRSAGLPIPYVEANLPQAWAAGSVFMLLRAILGLDPDPASRTLVVRPTLPEWLPDLTLRNLTILGGTLDLRFRGVGLATEVEVLGRGGEVQVEARPGDERVELPHDARGSGRSEEA